LKTAVFSSKPHDREFLSSANAGGKHELVYFEARLGWETAALANGFPCVCAFVNDRLNLRVLDVLASGGTGFIALRSAGFNNVDIKAACSRGIRIARVPAYSPNAVAEFTVALILNLNRKIHRAYARVREGNFSLDGLMGFDLNGKTVGIIGTGKIGVLTAHILSGFGCRVIGYDPVKNPDAKAAGLKYVSLNDLYRESDIISLHCPLVPETFHLINAAAIKKMKPGVMLVNTSRGAVINTKNAVKALKNGGIGSLGMDVYEEEEATFFENLSDKVIQDDVLARLMTLPNVIITSHQAFFTREALSSIAAETLGNITDFENGRIKPANEITLACFKRRK
jgi:D-lactate dehydrogenase